MADHIPANTVSQSKLNMFRNHSLLPVHVCSCKLHSLNHVTEQRRVAVLQAIFCTSSYQYISLNTVPSVEIGATPADLSIQRPVIILRPDNSS